MGVGEWRHIIAPKPDKARRADLNSARNAPARALATVKDDEYGDIAIPTIGRDERKFLALSVAEC